MESVWILGDGLRLHAARWDTPLPHGGQQVLALHGFTGSAEDFEPLAAHSMHELRWHALDLPGHGRSDAPSNLVHYTAPALVRHLQRTERELGLRQYILIGYSMGARTALYYALQRPQNIAALVLVGGTPGLIDPQERRARRLEDEHLAARIERMPIKDFMAEWMEKSIITTQRNIAAPIREAMLERRRKNNPLGLANALRGFGTGTMPVMWDKLIGLQIPTLLVTGSEDIKFACIARHMEFRLRHVMRTQILGAGHCAHLEYPGRFCRLLDGFTAQRLCA